MSFRRKNQEELAEAAHVIEARRLTALTVSSVVPTHCHAGAGDMRRLGRSVRIYIRANGRQIYSAAAKLNAVRHGVWRKRRITTESHRPDAGAGAGRGVDISLPFHGCGLK